MNEIDQFFHAIRTKNTEMVEILMPLHLHTRSHDGSTPMLAATHICCREYIELFVANGANINDVDNTGLSCLMIACEKGQEEIVHLLCGKPFCHSFLVLSLISRFLIKRFGGKC